MSRRVCARCGTVWSQAASACGYCGFDQSIVQPDPFKPDRTDEHLVSRPVAQSSTLVQAQAQPASYSSAPLTPSGHPNDPTFVRVIDVKLTGGSVFELIFKFTVAFLVIDALVLIVLAIIIAAVVG